MPYEWLKNPEAPDAAGDRLLARLSLWPHRSRSPQGFVLFISVTCAMLTLPPIGLIGTSALWGLLPFAAATVAGVWFTIGRGNHAAGAAEDPSLWSDRAVLRHRDPDGREQKCEANPYWVSVHLHETGGPVPSYLAMRGAILLAESGAVRAMVWNT